MALTVKELKKLLDKYPDDMKIIKHGREQGFDYVEFLVSEKVSELNNPLKWSGELESDENGESHLLID